MPGGPDADAGLAERIAEAAIGGMAALKGRAAGPNQWTLMAAIVAENAGALRVVSLATGTRCFPGVPEDPDGTLRDSHAEILARRAFQRYALGELAALGPAGAEQPAALFERCDAGAGPGPPFRMKDGVALHLFVSDAPCGDASIYRLRTPKDGNERRYTGAKLAGADAWEHERCQALGRLRLKGARGDLPAHRRSRCMSCSDKVARWAVLGIHGSALSRLLRSPVFLDSVTVPLDDAAESRQAMLEALRRGIVERSASAVEETGRAAAAAWRPPRVLVADRQFPLSRQQVAKAAAAGDGRPRKRARTGGGVGRPSSLSVNFVADPFSPGGTLETTDGLTGLRQGATRRSGAKAESRLSRRRLLEASQALLPAGAPSPTDTAMRELFFGCSAFRDWVRSGRAEAKPTQGDGGAGSAASAGSAGSEEEARGASPPRAKRCRSTEAHRPS